MLMRIKALVLMGLLAVSAQAAEPDSISAAALSARLGGGDAPLVLDVRTEGEYDSGHVPGAVHIPHTELPARLSELPEAGHSEIVVYCEVGGRARVAENILEDAGYTRVRALEGHMRNWRAGGFPRD